jgi:hypothetical protein
MIPTCPSCRRHSMQHIHTPWLLRALALIPGLNPRMLECDLCRYRFISWQDRL